MSNTALDRARKTKNDEFYTFLEDIENELQYYTQFFDNKVIYCFCDSLKSNFTLYFQNNLSKYNLKGLHCTSMEEPNGSHFYFSSKEGYYKKLNTNGNFFSDEIKNIREQSDILVTNPPFSCLKEIVNNLIEENKQFILVGNENLLVSRKIFPLVKDGIIKPGFTKIKEFLTPEGVNQKFGNIIWITNLPIIKPDYTYNLSAHYSPERYPKYENYEAINVDKLIDIPQDYDGIMGVPITYLTKQSSQFKILGYAGGTTRNNGLNYSVPYFPHLDDHGGNGMVNGKRKYGRIFIQRK